MESQETDEFGFLNKFIEDAMYLYWPHPTRDYYCRFCNFIEFPDQYALDEHKRTQQHWIFQSSESEAFCYVCQCHVYNSKMMVEHCQTRRHCKLVEIFEKAKEDGCTLWKEKLSKYPNSEYQIPLERHSKKDFEKTSSIKNTEKENINYLRNSKAINNSSDDVLITNVIEPKKSNRLMTNAVSHTTTLQNPNCIKQSQNVCDPYAEDVELISNRIKEFVSDHIELIIADEKRTHMKLINFAMDPYWKIPKCEFFCTVCNFKVFSSKEEMTVHSKTALHKKFVTASQGLSCKFCKMVLLSRNDLNEHNKYEFHKKCKYLYEKCKKDSLEEICKVIDNHAKAKKDYQYMHKLLYPWNKLGLISEDYCFICCEYSKNILTHVREQKHQRILREYYQKLKQDGYVYVDGCAICEENNFDSIESHKNSDQHKLSVVDYRKIIGLIENDEEREELKKILHDANQSQRSSKGANGKKKDTNNNLSTEEFIAAIRRGVKRKQSADTNKENFISLTPNKRNTHKS